MTYNCLKQQTYQEDSYVIVPIRKEDMSSIKLWRNGQIGILRQERDLTDEDQLQYWKNELEPNFSEQRPKQILFSFLKDGNCIGYGGLTHIGWDAGRGEVSFLLETSRTVDKRSYHAEFKVFLTLLRKAVFEDLNFHRMFTETFNVRPEHIETLEDFGFKLEGSLKDHVKVDDKYYDSLIHGLIRDE